MNALRKWLLPLSPIYGAVVWLRNKCYDWGIFPQEEFEVPILCIGNLSVGGTGKTPMTEWLLENFAGDKKIAVLSRGYGRKSRGFRWVNPEDSFLETGDEPLQIARNYPEVTVAVDGNRRRGIKRINAAVKPDLILLDDAFQHRKVRPKISLLLTTWADPFSQQIYLPAGDLRDHKSQVRRADVVVVTKCPELPDAREVKTYRSQLGLAANIPLVFATMEYSEIRDNSGALVDARQLQITGLVLVTGIAHPEPLVSYLRQKGLEFTHRQFPDHHKFTTKEIDLLLSAKSLLTTAKDAVRLERYIERFNIVRVAHKFEAENLSLLKEVLGRLWE